MQINKREKTNTPTSQHTETEGFSFLGHLVLGAEILFVCYLDFFFFFEARLYSLGYPRTHCVDQASPKLIEINLLLPPEHWD